MIDRSELHRELDRYLTERRKNYDYQEYSFAIKQKKEQKKAEKVENEADMYEDGEKQGFFKKLFSLFKSPDYEEVEQSLVQQDLAKTRTPASSELTQDMKEVAKITLEVIKMLPPEKLDDLKRDPIFSKLKEVLKKNNLIK